MASTSVSSSISRGRGVIEQINPRLFAGQFNGKDSEPLYFGFEEVTSENKQFWRGYQKSAGALQDLLRRFSASVTESSYPAYPNELSEYFSYNEEQYYSVVKHIQKNRLFHAELEKIDSGLWEMADVCYPTGTTYSRLGKFYHNIKVFMVYL